MVMGKGFVWGGGGEGSIMQGKILWKAVESCCVTGGGGEEGACQRMELDGNNITSTKKIIPIPLDR